MAQVRISTSKPKIRILREAIFAKISESKIMELVLQYLWTPLVLAIGGLTKMIFRHDKEIAACIASHEGLISSVEDAKNSRKQLYEKIESVRVDLTKQQTLMRTEQREDFQEIRNSIDGLRE